MITTNSHNDFSNFSWEQKKDFDFMLNSILEFHNKGGDLSLPVKVGQSIDSFSLISLNKFITDNISDSVRFNKELIERGVLPGFCDFEYDTFTSTISENSKHNITWMKNNFNDYSEIILSSFRRLLKSLPNDYEKVKSLKGVDYYGKETILATTEKSTEIIRSRNYNPIFYIAEKLKEISIYEMIFEKYPDIKKEWLKSTSRFEDKPIFLESIDSNSDHIRNSKLGIFFFKNGIGVDYFLNKNNSSHVHDLIKEASYSGDIDFLKSILPKINLSEIEVELSDSSLSISVAKNKEVIKILLDNGASFKHTLNKNYRHDVNLLYSRESSSATIIDAILEHRPEEIENFKKNYDFLYGNLEYKNFPLTQLIVSKYEFPLEKYDMLYIAKKQNKGEISDTEQYEWLVKNGADIRKCDKFCKSVVDSREEGLKLLRNLNKKGIIVSKSSDMVFNILRSKPTKTFLNYYDKITSSEIEKYTIEGYPAWWGSTNFIDLKWALSKVNNPEQLSQQKEPYFMFALRQELILHKFNANHLIEEQLKVAKKKNPSFNLDISYQDKENNNFLHYLFKLEKYYKDNIDANLLEVIKNNTTQNIFEKINSKNKEGISPLEILLTQEYKTNWSVNNILTRIIEENSDLIIWENKVLDTDKNFKDLFLEFFNKNKDMETKINALALEQQLTKNVNAKTKKIKL